MELDEPENPMDPLSETWQETLRQLERLDRQINAKIRLLLRLGSLGGGQGCPALPDSGAC